MKIKILVLSFIGFTNLLAYAGGEAPELTPPVPGIFDSFVLAMSYQNDFCAANPSKKECQDGAGHFGMALHGLWPDQKADLKNKYQYCSSTTEQQVSKNWCAADIDVSAQMGSSVFSALKSVMPGTESCLYNHEWYAHGTCSGLNTADYFGDAQNLASRFRALTHFQTFISSAAGTTVSKDQLLAALTQDLGSQAQDAAVFLCRKVSGQDYFSEVDISLTAQSFMDFPAPKSLGVRKDQGSCPSDGITIISPN